LEQFLSLYKLKTIGDEYDELNKDISVSVDLAYIEIRIAPMLKVHLNKLKDDYSSESSINLKSVKNQNKDEIAL
jgi:hypothetical protein